MSPDSLGTNRFDDAPEISPNYLSTDEELAKLAGDIANTIFHPVGTAKMGAAGDPMADVDEHQSQTAR